MSAGWFNPSEQAQTERPSSKASEGEMMRFFVRPGAQAQIVFLDDTMHRHTFDGMPIRVTPFRIVEHKIWDVVNNRAVFATCLGENCPICAYDKRPRRVGYFTVLDVTEYQSQRTGKMEKRRTKSLFATYGTAEAVFKAEITAVGRNLKGAKYLVTRTGPKTPTVGETFTFMQHEQNLAEQFPDVDLKPYGLDAVSAFNWYYTLLSPPTDERVRSILRSLEDGSYRFGMGGPGGSGPKKPDTYNRPPQVGNVSDNGFRPSMNSQPHAAGPVDDDIPF